MAVDTYLSTIEPKNKMKKQNRNKFIENILMVARWERGEGGREKKVKGLRSTNWLLQNTNGDVK